MVTGLRFVQLEVEDLERSLQFYRDGLGLRAEEVAPSDGTRTACVEAGEFELVLAQTTPPQGPRGAGVQLFLNTHDVDRFSAALQSRGVQASPPAQEPLGARVTRLRDPD